MTRVMAAVPLRAVMLCVLLGAGGESLALEGLRPLETAWLDPGDSRIEWKESWPATYEANKKRWTQEVRDQFKDGRLRDQALAFRLIHLLEELIKRYPADSVRRRAAYEELAERFAQAGCRGRGNYYLKRIVDEFPGEADLVAATLQKILTATHPHRRETEEGDAWVEYAITRLRALNRSGHLPSRDVALEQAWKASLELAAERGDFWGAAQALRQLEAITGRDTWWRVQEAELLLAAGRRDEAIRLLEELAAEGVEGRVASLLRELARERVPPPVDFIRRWALEARWEAARDPGGGPDATRTHALLGDAARAEGFTPWGRAVHTSLWAQMDRELLAQPADALAALRQLQQRDAARRIADARDARDPQELFVLWRRYPWAADVQAAMLEWGEAALRQGHAGLAGRAFRDALSHSADPAVRAKAQVGLWLTLRDGAADPAELDAAFGAIPTEALHPWMGERITTAALRRLLIAGLDAAAPAPRQPAEPSRRLLLALPDEPWASGARDTPGSAAERSAAPPLCIQAVEAAAAGRYIVAGPDLLACFGERGGAPLWWRHPPAPGPAGASERSRARVAPPAPFRAALAGRRIFTRWGVDPAGLAPTAIAAFDADSGEILWSTRGNAAWEGLEPIADPTIADGCLYVLAIRGTAFANVPVWLVCLDADDGELLWERFLTSCPASLARAGGSPRNWSDSLDLARHGGGPLVHDGSVYCMTNMGSVVRCDARDGLVEWVRSYPRVRMGRNLDATLRRQGTRPLAARGAVVFAPRDYTGAFALDPETGRLLWEAPFAPSHQVVGLAGDALLLRDETHVVALDVASGRLLWERVFPHGMDGRVSVAGGELRLLSGGVLFRLDGETGQTLDQRRWAVGEAVRDFVIHDDAIVAVTDRLSGAGRGQPAPTTPAPESLDVPLSRAWSLRRPGPSLWLPPDGSPLSGRAYLFSQGVLECLSQDASGKVHWRRAVRGGFRGIEWAGPMMLLVYPRGVLALDALKGDCRWEAELPFEATEWKVCGDHLLAARPKQGRDVALVRLATGQAVWSRSFAELFGRPHFTLDAAAWDGKDVHLLASRFLARREAPADVIVRAADGSIAALRPFPRDGEAWPPKLAVGEGFAFLVSQEKALCEYSLGDGSLRQCAGDMRQLDPRKIQKFALTGPWLQVCWDKGYDAVREKHWVLRRGEPAFLRRREAWGAIRGDALFEAPDGARSLTRVELRTGKATTYKLPEHPDVASTGKVLDFFETPQRAFVASHASIGRGAAVRVDSFDRGTGAHVAADLLPGVEARENQIAWAPDAMLVTDPAGLHCFVAAAPSDERPRPVQVAYRLEPPLPPGGSILDSSAEDILRLADPSSGNGAVHVAHSADRLHIAVRYRDERATPCAERGADPSCGCGDWIELGLRTNQGTYQWALGLRSNGRPRVEGVAGTPVPEGTRAVLWHNPAARETTCELSLPWQGVFRQSDDWRRIALWAVAWDDRPAAGGPAQVFRWGQADAVREAVYLDARTREQGGAITAIIHALPDLSASLDLFTKSAKMRSASPGELVERYWQFISDHPTSRAAELLLLEIERAEERSAEQRKALLGRAARAGVPEPVLKRHAWCTDACLSQWVHVDAGRDLRSVLLELNGDAGPDEWGHRACWGKPVTAWLVPPCVMGPVDELPERKWHELRVPLFLIGLHDAPIRGINFCQQGPPRIVWDRSAVVAGGKETVFLDDEAPKGSLRNTWEWVADPRRSGARAHTHPPPAAHYEVRSHTVLDMDTPVTAHLAPPLDRPYVSQWVWLDPADPPRTLAISLHDGRRWACRLLWGERSLGGRYMGPLPKAGQWHELRVPLAWTPFLARSIAGLGFCHNGGRVLWDTTTLVIGGKEHLLLGDEPPAIRVRPGKREWQSWVDGHRGGTYPVLGKVGVGVRCDGMSGCVVVPHAPELDPPQFTVETWVYLDAFAPGADTKQWLVNKNGHAWADGYFGLILYRDKVVADLNIGGDKENRFEAWAEEGTLRLKQWHHLAMTYDAVALRLYRDGELVAETPVNKERQPGSGALLLGRWANGHSYFAGVLDEVRLYSRALSAAEIRARAAEPAALAPPVAKAAVGHWGFDSEASPRDPMSDWVWVEKPSRSGRRVHTNPSGPGFRGHAIYPLREPVVQHLPFSPPRAVALLQQQIPRLGLCEEAWQFFEEVLQLELPDPQRRIELNKWFLTTFPGHPRTPDILGSLLDACAEAGEADPIGRVIAIARGFGLPVSTLYHFHRRHAREPRQFVSAWQVIGPFPGEGEGWGLHTPQAPESDGVRLDKAYAGLDRQVRWAPFTSEGSYVNLKLALGPMANAVAYAAAWVHSDRDRSAVMAIGSDDWCKVWVNRRLILSGKNLTYASAGEFIAPVQLSAGWNEVLVKVTQGIGEWGFYFELLDDLARRLPPGVKLSATPPPER